MQRRGLKYVIKDASTNVNVSFGRDSEKRVQLHVYLKMKATIARRANLCSVYDASCVCCFCTTLAGALVLLALGIGGIHRTVVTNITSCAYMTAIDSAISGHSLPPTVTEANVLLALLGRVQMKP